MRYLLVITFSLLFAACSAHNNGISAPTINSHSTCSDNICGVAELPWQEILRRKNITAEPSQLPVQSKMSAAVTQKIIRDVYQSVMATTNYHQDNEIYGRFDLYPTPRELENGKQNGIYRGDCTTFSHLFYYKLIERGIHPSRLLRVRMDNLHRQGPVTNHMTVLVDNTWLLDNNEPSRKVIRFMKSSSTPKMWISETKVGWYMAARGNSPLLDTRFKGFSMAMF